MNRKTVAMVVFPAVLSLVLGLMILGCGKTSTKPEIKTLDPTSGPPGSEVAIEGGSFGATQGTGVVFFDNEEAEVVSWSDTSITVKVPDDLTAAKYGIKVETGEGASNTVEFEVTKVDENAPKISSLSPESGGPGTEVKIEGNKFGDTQGSGKVLFGPGTADVVSWSDTSITFKVPADATPNTYGVTVETAAGKSGEAIFTIGGEDLSAQKAAIISYLQNEGQSTAGSENWTLTLVKKSAQDPNWEVVKVNVPGGTAFEAVLIFNNMLGDWQALKTGEPPWTGVEFKGESIPSDLENI